MTTSVMLDIETLGTKPNTTILTIGAVKFDPYSSAEPGNGLYIKLDVDSQIESGRTVDQDTLDWWGKQDPTVMNEALGECDSRISVDEFHIQLNQYLVGVTDIWCQGPVFDIGILEDLYRQHKWSIPWNFWQIRDSRTLFGVHGDPRVKNKEAHNALVDSYTQACAVQQIYKQLGLRPR